MGDMKKYYALELQLWEHRCVDGSHEMCDMIEYRTIVETETLRAAKSFLKAVVALTSSYYVKRKEVK